jgi:hypothetical protein
MGALRISTNIAPAGMPTNFFSTSRLFIVLEVLLGAAIVIGHNVFHVVPNEVPILVVLGLISIRLRTGR